MKNKNTAFELQFNQGWFKPGDIILTTVGEKGKIIQTKKWYKRLLQFITLGIYKAPYQYKVKLINND